MTDARGLLRRLVAAFPSQEIGEHTLILMAEKLADLPYERLETAVEEHIERGRFFPTIAELRSRAGVYLPPYTKPYTALPPWEGTPDHSRASVAELDRLGILGPDGKTRGFPNRAYYEGLQRAQERMDQMLAENARKRAAHRPVQSNPTP